MVKIRKMKRTSYTSRRAMGYIADITCTNCGLKTGIRIPKSVRVEEAVCPLCKCSGTLLIRTDGVKTGGRKGKQKPNKYSKFIGEQMKKGLGMKEAAILWQGKKVEDGKEE